MFISQKQERYARVAAELLRTQNPDAIFMLKNLLTYFPSPTQVRNILTTAIIHLINTSPTTICWLLKYPNCLQPEVDVVQIVTQVLASRLSDYGFVQGQDFTIDADRKFKVSEAAQLALLAQSQILNTEAPLSIIDYLQTH